MNEGDFISELIKTNKPRAIKFKNLSCFIDNKCNLNYSNVVFKSFLVIYPKVRRLNLLCKYIECFYMKETLCRLNVKVTLEKINAYNSGYAKKKQ